MSFLLLLAMPIIIILYFLTQKPKHAKKLNPPGPPGLPFIGNLHHFDGRFPHTYLRRLSVKYGPVMSLKLGFRRLVVISSADAVKEIMKSHDAVFSSRPVLVTPKRLSYNGLDVAFSPYNTWREMRKISTITFFNTKQVESFHPIFKDEVSKMMEKIARDASSSTTTDLSETMMSFTSNIISRVAFGKIYGDDKGYGKNRYFDLLRETQPIIGAFFVEDYLPSFRWIDRLFGMAAKLDKIFHNIDSFCEELIEEHMNPERPKFMDGDIVDILLGIQENGSSSFDLTLNHIKALLMDLIAGGSDTAAAALVWVLTALMKRPMLMKKLKAEIRQLAGKKDMIDEQDAKLPYLKAVVKGTLRLYPPAPLLIPRETIEKCSLHGYEIEGGSMVYINAWAIARDPATWKDADEFLPERFLEADIDVRGQNPEVIPFGFGRRGCPGIGMAMAEVELALANVVYKFEWELPVGMKEEDIDLEVRPGMAMHKRNALCLVAKIAM